MALQDTSQIENIKVFIGRGADGAGITDISLTSSQGNEDLYTITLSDGTTYTFTVTNGKSISGISVEASGNVDIYTITYDDGTSSTFEVTSGRTASAISYDDTVTDTNTSNVQTTIDKIAGRWFTTSALTGATQVTVSGDNDFYASDTDVIDVFSQNPSGTPISINTVTVDDMQIPTDIIVTFDALEEDTDFKIHVIKV